MFIKDKAEAANMSVSECVIENENLYCQLSCFVSEIATNYLVLREFLRNGLC